ncbi:hypothetical protein [Candidatus Nanohalococcus occultus]|uniref:hypothetical protein n=1 Tax=Candidatus Nanohalococcus occultus TaxID=2978047 RepID=UPI00325FAAE9
MRKSFIFLTALLLIGVISAHTDNHSAHENQTQQPADDGAWNSLMDAYPSQTLSIVLIEIVVVSAITIAAVRHRYQLRSK